jgi:hypothetical protein
MPEETVRHEDVEVARLSSLTTVYRIAGREVMIGDGVRLAGTSARHPGERGTLVVPRWFAVQERLPLPEPAP